MSQGIIWSMLELTGDKKYYGQAGTETNPYGIEDVLDFCAIKNDKDKDITYYLLLNNLDFNNHDIYKSGFKDGTVVNASKSVLDCNGKEIRNIVAYNDSKGTNDNIFVLKEINNCKFANTISFATTRALFLSNFNKCSFYFMISNAKVDNIFRSNSTGGCTLNKCTITLSGTASTFMSFGNNVFNYCNFIFKDFAAKLNTGIYNLVVLMQQGTFDHTYFLGSMSISPSNNSNNRALFYGSILSNVYYAVECDLSGGSKVTSATYMLDGGSGLATSFTDKGLLSYVNARDQNNSYLLATASCKTTSELVKIGFPVIRL